MKIKVGEHIILELIGVDEKLLSSEKFFKKVLINAAKKSKLKVLKIVYHKFNPIGLTAVALLKQSHITIHTFPEYKYVACDIFSCGNTNVEEAAKYVIKKLKPKKTRKIKIKRGF
ncbi:MAG: adenosylmethionine decarboxylase [Candidatus Aenigmarchaeota archaeon]|nr:adenosylmethionine decarboxylase [Candidatus Aenigmarchaeota archaeon]MDW8149201.1 adenosylmethionine decarboxylase [Candidatus Aenigmarchaeota archaeon]